MITVEDFLAKVQEIVNENPTYRSGGSGDDGTCDCIGLIMGAMYRCGHKRFAIHGSNYFVRCQTYDISSADPIEPGMLVYKVRQTGEAGYALPDRYKQGGGYYNGDLGDYYHVGVVTGVCPTVITHCTSSGNVNGIKIDTKESDIRRWAVCGYIADVEYDGGDEMDRTATVIAPSGSTVNMRKRPDKSAEIIAKVPIGSTVTVMEAAQEWATIVYNGQRGYMMQEFLLYDEGGESVASGILEEENAVSADENAGIDTEVLYRIEEKLDRLLQYFSEAEG